MEARRTYLESMQDKIAMLRKEKALKNEEGETKDDLDEQIE